MKPIRIRSCVLSSVVLLAGLSSGCTPTNDSQDLLEKDFNARLRPDLRPLSRQQTQMQEPGFGPYRIGSDEAVSPAIPIAAISQHESQAANLQQSDCLWMAHDSGRGRGDRLRLRWEEVLHFEPVTESVEVQFLPQLATCSSSDPVTRSPAYVVDGSIVQETESALEAGATAVYVVSGSQGLRVTEEPGEGERLVLACGASGEPESFRVVCEEGEVGIADVRVLASRATLPSDNPDGECRRQTAWNLQTTLGPGDFGLALPLRAATYAPACMAQGTDLMPSRDVSFGVSASAAWMEGRSEAAMPRATLGPTVMVVNGTRRIRRAMRVEDDGERRMPRWSVARTTLPDGRERWSENFLPSVAVEYVTLTAKDALSGTPSDAFARQDLCLERVPGTCAYVCSAVETSTASRLDYRLSEQYCRTPIGDPALPYVSPAYDNASIPLEAGTPQRDPLVWRLRTPATEPLPWVRSLMHIEFRLQARLPAGAALTAEQGLVDFGASQVNGFSARRTRIRNDGDVPMRIERVEAIDDGSLTSHPERFRVLLPGPAVRVPAPIDFVPAGKSLDEVAVGPGEDFERQPLLRAVEGDRTAGLVMQRVEHAEFELYDHPFSVIDGLVVTDATGRDFEAAARQAYLRRNPGAAEHAAVGRLLGFDAHSLRELPTIVEPGGVLDLHIAHAPRDFGRGSALLRVVGTAANGPAQSRTVHVVLRGDSLSGPILRPMPGAVRLPIARQDGPAWRAGVAVVNEGQWPGKVAGVRLEGRDAAQFALASVPEFPRSMPPGDAFRLIVEAIPPGCGRSHEADLVFDTESGIPVHLPVSANGEACP